MLVTDARSAAQSDLDAFMQQVLEQRDSNWKKLQQYVLDEREQIDLRGPSGRPLWGDRRDYTWYIRDGFFVRSPVKVNGARERHGVEARERMKRIALDLRARHRRIQEAEIE